MGVTKTMGTMLLSMVLAACGTRTTGAPTGDTSATTTVTDSTSMSDDPVADALRGLGIDIGFTPRVDPDRNALPDDYLPFGSRSTLGRIDELMIIGAAPRLSDGTPVTADVAFVEDDPDTAAAYDVMHAVDVGDWATEIEPSGNRLPRASRAAAAGDIDGDGHDEGLVVFVDLDDVDVDTEIVLETFDDAVADDAFGRATQRLAVQAGVVDMAMASGDLDGDSYEGVVVGLSTDTAAHVLFAVNAAGTLDVDDTQTVTLTPQTDSADLEGHGLRIATGNLDYDVGHEIVVAMNEFSGGGSSGVARYWIFDDANAGFAELASGMATVVDGAAHTAVQLDVSIGDIDGDYIDEVVLGGLSAYLGQSCDGPFLVGLALDDAVHGFAELGGTQFRGGLSCSDATAHTMRFAYVNTLDVDADRVDEVLIHTQAFANFRDAPPFTDLRLGGFAFSSNAVSLDDAQTYLDRNTYTMATGDVDGDLTEDLIVWTQDLGTVSVLGIDAETGRQRTVFEVGMDLSVSSETPLHPIVVPLNMDDDSMVLAAGEPVATYVWTEPLVIAALAAAPCYEDPAIGQFVTGCSTQFGQEVSKTVSEQQTVSQTTNASVGISVGVDLIQSGIEAKAIYEEVGSTISGTSYDLTKSIVFTNVAQEDTVIFTTVPYDQYTYTILAHPDEELVGADMTVSLPREPITLMVEAGFYNDVVAPGAVRVDEQVFAHTVGDPGTYLTAADKDAIVALTGDDLANGPTSVGQGEGGIVSLGIDVGTAITKGSTFASGWSGSVELTLGGVLGGYSWGRSTESNMVVEMGESTVYTGSIGSLPAASFADRQYAFGILTYMHNDDASGQEFQVVNYWVE